MSGEGGDRSLEIEGTIWRVSAVGQTRTGFPPDTGAILLLLRFESEGEDPCEGWVVARTLDEVDEDSLIQCLESTRPPKEPT
jgi:hypothetical protein